MIILAQFRGTSPISWAIKKQTRSVWSHSAAIFRDSTVVESWYKGGVSHIDEGSVLLNLSKNHKPGTIVDIFHIPCTEEQATVFETYLIAQKGCGYDWMSIARFITKKPAFMDDKWFCSELFNAGANRARVTILQNIRSAQVSPQLLGISPVPQQKGSLITV